MLEAIWDEAGEATNVTLRDDVQFGDKTTTVLAVAIVADVSQNPSRVVFFDSVELTPITAVEVGAAPDKVTFTPAGSPNWSE